MQVLTHTQFRDLVLTGGTEATFVTILAVTSPAWKSKRCELAGRVYKRARVNATLNWVYERAVNRQREREGKEADFVAEERQWGHKVSMTPFVQHGDKLYLSLKVHRTLSCEFFDVITGEVVPNETVYPLLRESQDGGRQNVSSPVIYRDYTLTNISEIRWMGELYRLEPDPIPVK
jgi:hypothetical protein